MKRIVVALMVFGWVSACAVDGGDAAAGGWAQRRSADGAELIVVHTGTSVQALSATSANRARARIEEFYPVVCLDTDDDHDGAPDSMDPTPPADGGVSFAHGCKRCNRGPGTNGDFRLDVRGDEVELDRGRISKLDNGVITVLGPSGNLTFTLSASSRIDDGPATPGAEIRIEGGVVSANSFTVNRLKVLCPGPGALTPQDTPSGGNQVPVDPDEIDGELDDAAEADGGAGTGGVDAGIN